MGYVLEQNLVAKLETLIDRLLVEREELRKRNQDVLAERDYLVKERIRVQDELEALLDKLDLLGGDKL